MASIIKVGLWAWLVIFLHSVVRVDALEEATESLIQVEWKQLEEQEEPQELCVVEEPCCTPGHTVEYFLGPSNCAINPSVYPICEGGELFFKGDVLLWLASVPYLDNSATGFSELATSSGNYQKKGADLLSPCDVAWAAGFGITMGYHSACDGWTTLLGWVRHATSVEGNYFKNQFDVVNDIATKDRTNVTNVTYIVDKSQFIFNIFDLTSGRPRWVSRYLEVAPFSGTRVVLFESKWEETVKTADLQVDRDYVYEFLAVGSLCGVRSVWHFCNGIGFFNQWSIALLYGSFDISLSQNVMPLNAMPLSDKVKQFKDLHFSLSSVRPGFDVAMGLEWTALVSGHLVSLSAGWEGHLYLDQSPLYRPAKAAPAGELYGDFYFEQTRDLSLQGLVFSLTLGF